MSIPTPLIQYSLSDATMKDLLPSGYLPLEYIESTGTQYIDTNYYPHSVDLFELKVRFNANTVQQRLFCSKWGISKTSDCIANDLSTSSSSD